VTSTGWRLGVLAELPGNLAVARILPKRCAEVAGRAALAATIAVRPVA